ncbi:MAG: GTP-binding protein [Sporolactobacillus sp.]
MARIPVTLLSGYLGSGKTTLLLHLLHDAHDKRIGIVVNDLAATNIDAKTIQQSQDFTDNDKLVAISGGSIGSDYRQSFCDAIYTLANSGTIDLLVVEASGIARPQLAAKAIVGGRNSEGRTLCTVCRRSDRRLLRSHLRMSTLPTQKRLMLIISRF